MIRGTGNEKWHTSDRPELLIVEDSRTQAELLRSILEEEGYLATIARTGEDALQQLEKTMPTLVIADINMPGMDGYELCGRIRQDERLKRIPVILLTSLSDPKDVLKGLECGADNFITKPYDKRQLISRVQNICSSVQLRQNERMQLGVEVVFAGKRHFITSERQQILDLLLATYETAVQVNLQLREAKEQLRVANAGLEKKVAERTAALEQELRERERAEESLRQSEKRYRDLFESNPHPMWVYDEETLRFLAVNEAAINNYGYSREEFLDMTIKEIRPPEDIPRLLAEVNAARPGLDRGIWRHRRKDGSVIDVEISSHEMKFAGRQGRLVLANNVTERKQAERVIRKQADLLDCAQDAIYVTEGGKITYWNRSAERLFGWSAAEVVGKELLALLFEGKIPDERALQQLKKENRWIGELSQRSKSGAELIVESRWTRILDSWGMPETILYINTDITEKKKLETQLLHAQRLESIGALASGVAHDLNNALAPVLLGSEILRNELKSEAGQRVLETIQGSAQKGAEMVKQILAFARGIQGRRQLLQIKHLVEDISRLAKVTFPRTIRIIKRIPADLAPIYGDATELHQVLLNLCVNARDAMPEGGELIIEGKNVKLQDKQTRMQAAALTGSFISLRVEDTGSGILPELLDKIFEPFFTTKERGKGTGLGLSTVVRIVQQHGGFLEVESEPGKGSVFTLYFPAAKELPSSEEAAAHPHRKGGAGEQILLVDDESALLEMARHTLEAFNYRVIPANNGAEGIFLYRRHSEDIRLVITDMNMPVMDGKAFIQELRAININIKIICATGSSQWLDRQAIEELKPAVLLPKPYTMEKLLGEVYDILHSQSQGSEQN